ncbi:MAG: ATP-binding protein [Acidobacteriota bacterium]
MWQRTTDEDGGHHNEGVTAKLGFMILPPSFSAVGDYKECSEPIILIGDCRTGKTHFLASGLCVATSRQKKRARFIPAAGLVNELVEAQHHNQLGRVLQGWSRYDLIVIDEGRLRTVGRNWSGVVFK